MPSPLLNTPPSPLPPSPPLSLMATASPRKDPLSPAAFVAADTGSPSLSLSSSPSVNGSSSPTPLATSPPLPMVSSLAAPPSRRLAAPIWNHEETLALIDAYRDKWYALRRGNLRASDWQEVADDVSRRCPSGSSPLKTSVQCRHKVEKLRKRYRSERSKSLQRDPSLAPSSSWVYFRKMDTMEHGDGGAGGLRRPIHSHQPNSPYITPSPPAPPYALSDDDHDQEENEDEDDYFDGRHGIGGRNNNSSIHRLIANGRGPIGELEFNIPKAVRSKLSRADDRPIPKPGMNPNHTSSFYNGYAGSRPMEETRHKLKKKRRMETESSELMAVASALRMLGDGFLKMEQKKMEMAREMEKMRMDMELQRTELILDTQRRILDAFSKGFSGNKRSKVSRKD